MCIKQSRQSGITLIEQIVFIIIVSVGVIGLVSVLGSMVQRSADPMQTKQLAAIAESLLGEVLHQPFTWCDPEDANASTALSYAGCAANPQNTLTTVPLGGEGRNGGAGAVYDNVADYGGWGMNDINDASGANAMVGYRADVAVAQAGNALGLADNSAALAVTVTVSRNGETFALTGYRFRYAPRT